GGRQPMRRGALTIIFNGEIYNYRELRAGLEARGVTFTSHSDTEVMLRLFEEQGTAMVSELRGMFAIALWDDAKKRLFLARDPYGIKPLYYADEGGTVRCASRSIADASTTRRRSPRWLRGSTECRTRSAISRLPISKRSCRAFSRRWISRPSMGSTAISSARRRRKWD